MISVSAVVGVAATAGVRMIRPGVRSGQVTDSSEAEPRQHGREREEKASSIHCSGQNRLVGW